jgi:hypothetical protein
MPGDEDLAVDEDLLRACACFRSMSNGDDNIKI